MVLVIFRAEKANTTQKGYPGNFYFLAWTLKCTYEKKKKEKRKCTYVYDIYVYMHMLYKHIYTYTLYLTIRKKYQNKTSIITSPPLHSYLDLTIITVIPHKSPLTTRILHAKTMANFV